MASFKKRQSSDTNQSVPETGYVPETHSYQEKHFQPVLNEPVRESSQYTEYGAAVRPDDIVTRKERTTRSDVMETSDQPGSKEETESYASRQLKQGNSDSGTQYSTPDVGSGISSGSAGGSAVYGGTTAAATATATSAVAATVASTAVAAAGAVIIAVTLILPMVIGVPSSIIFSEVVTTDTSVYYSIYFEDYDEDMELTVSLHNNFTNRIHTVDSEYISVVEEGLKPGMQYQLTVYGSMGVVLGERTVTTDTYSEPSLEVSTAEFSMTDGLIHLSAELNDARGECSDFVAVLYDNTDGKRTVIRSDPIADFSGEFTMDAGLAADTSVECIFAVECSVGGENRALYESGMTVYGTPYIGFRTTPAISGGQLDFDCLIIDPDSVRSNYYAYFRIENSADTTQYYSADGGLTDGRFTVTGITEYTYEYFVAEVSWDGEFSSDPLIYDYANYGAPKVILDESAITLTESNNYYDMVVPITVMDPRQEYGSLVMVLGDPTAESTTKGTAAVVSFDRTETSVTIPVTSNGLYGLTLPLTVRNGDDVLYSMSEKTVGPVMTIGQAYVNRLDTDDPQVQFSVEISGFVDDFHYLSDTDGNWTVMPVMESESGDQLSNPSVTATGDGSYLATSYYNNWNAAYMYCNEVTITAATYSETINLPYVTYESDVSVDVSGNTTVSLRVYTSDAVSSAKAVQGGTVIDATLTGSSDNYTIGLDLTGTDMSTEYEILLYDSSGNTFQGKLVMQFDYLVLKSTTYDSKSGQMTVVFDYSNEDHEITMDQQGATVTRNGTEVTLQFYGSPTSTTLSFGFEVKDPMDSDSQKLYNYTWEVDLQ